MVTESQTRPTASGLALQHKHDARVLRVVTLSVAGNSLVRVTDPRPPPHHCVVIWGNKT